MSLDEIRVLGTRAHPISMQETLSRCIELSRGLGNQHVVINAAKVVSLQEDSLLRSTIDEASLVGIDGQSVVWAARWLGYDVPERVAGIDLMHEIIRAAPGENLRLYFLGAEQSVVEKVVEFAEARGCTVAGFRNGYWTDEEESTIVSDIADLNVNVLFLGLPSPRKEHFVRTYRQALNTGLTIGVGGSFDVIAGKTLRAPSWMQKSGLEWAYRLSQEPKRMLKRYLVGNAKFIRIVLKEKLGPRSERPD
ncbi:WecB/TagA/CpsF family glycosyltransferase [Citricoccus sp. NPDC055426]|uniref:WecB/TagA/CpsF family glycosyltransferase n=1 Tax=Citricoccus sp. NPDC055426 TaxID=3155536 RepID=UPI003413B420